MKDPSGKFLIRVPKSLHNYLIIWAKEEGVSLNHLVSCILSAKVKSPINEKEKK